MRRVGLPSGGSTLTTSAPAPGQQLAAELAFVVGKLQDTDVEEEAFGLLRLGLRHIAS